MLCCWENRESHNLCKLLPFLRSCRFAINSGSQHCPGGSSIISLIPPGLSRPIDRQTDRQTHRQSKSSLLSLGFHYNRIWAINFPSHLNSSFTCSPELNKHLPDKTSKAKAYIYGSLGQGFGIREQDRLFSPSTRQQVKLSSGFLMQIDKLRIHLRHVLGCLLEYLLSATLWRRRCWLGY